MLVVEHSIRTLVNISHVFQVATKSRWVDNHCHKTTTSIEKKKTNRKCEYQWVSESTMGTEFPHKILFGDCMTTTTKEQRHAYIQRQIMILTTGGNVANRGDTDIW